MSYKFSRSDIRFFQVMYKVGTALAVLPTYSFEKFTILSPTLNKLYASFFLILEILCTSWIIYLRNSANDIRFFTLTFTSMGTCDDLLLALVKISLILNMHFFKTKKWVKLNNKFQFMDKKLNIRDQREKNIFKNVYMQFGVCSVLYLASVLDTVIVRVVEKGISTLRLFILHEFSGYYNLYVQILIWNMALAFRNRYQHINKQLIANTSSRKNFCFLKDTGETFRLLGEMVGLFNELFGLPLVFITGRCIIKILTTINFFMYALHINDNSLRSHLEIGTLAQTVTILGSITTLILSCDSAKSESWKTVFLCYKLREKFPYKSEEQKELLELAHITEKNTAYFTAAGFFEINRATLFGILGTTTTYLIVTLQFSQSMK